MVASAVDILLVEDNPGDVVLTRKAFADSEIDSTLHVAPDGEAALRFLRREGESAAQPRPDLVLLDLNLPRLSGHEVLAQLKADPALRSIPVVVLTSSAAPSDIQASYDRHANAYVTKPLKLSELVSAVSRLEGFWFRTARLPTGGAA